MRKFSDKIVEKNKTQFYIQQFVSRKSCRLRDRVEKYGRARQATDDNIIHSEYVILIAFTRQQWLRERASMLRYKYSACIVGCETCW
jgi:hypothetical protein